MRSEVLSATTERSSAPRSAVAGSGSVARRLLDASPTLAVIGGVATGVAVVVLRGWGNLPRSVFWRLGVVPEDHASFGLDVFAAFGTMSGFGLAALSLVAASATSPSLQAAIRSDAGRTILRTLVYSVWAWFLSAVLGLALVVTPAAESLLVVATGLAAGQGVAALLAFTVFFAERFLPLRQPER